MKAIEYYTRSIELNPLFFKVVLYVIKAYFNRGFVFNKIEKFEFAISDYTRAVELEPQNPFTYFNRAIAFEKINDYEKAIEDLSFSIKILPNKVEFYLKRAFLFKKLNSLNSAIKDYSNVIKLEINNSKALFNRGVCYESVLMYNEAEKDFEKVLSLDKNNVAYLFHLATVQVNEGSEEKRNQAFENYNSIIKIDPKFASAYNGIAIIYEKQQNFENAINFFNKAIELDNTNPIFLNNRGCILKNIGKYIKIQI